jgi:PQQ-dependent catabolism-associated beta-propeller protein
VLRRPCPFQFPINGEYALTYTILLLVFLAVRAQQTPALLFVSNELGRTITVIDADTRQPIGDIAVPGRPRGIAVSGDGRRVYVALSDTVRQKAGPADGIVAIDIAERHIIDRLPAGTDPEQFAISRDGHWIYASNEDAGTATGIDLRTRKIAGRFVVGLEPEGVAISPDDRWVYVTGETSNTVSVIDTRAQRVIANVLVPSRPRAATFSRDGRTAFVTSEIGRALTIIDVRTHAATATIAITDSGAKPVGVALSPDERLAYVATGRANSVAVVDLAARRQVASIPVGRRPWGIAISGDGRTVYTANGLSGDVSVIDTGTRQVVATIKAGAGPWGVVVTR